MPIDPRVVRKYMMVTLSLFVKDDIIKFSPRVNKLSFFGNLKCTIILLC